MTSLVSTIQQIKPQLETLASLTKLNNVSYLQFVNPIIDDEINVKCTTAGATQISGGS